MEKSKRTELSEIGEFGLIDKIKEAFPTDQQKTIRGIGDDAAVLIKNEEEFLLVSTDTLAEGIHFDLTYVPLMHLGYKAVVVNLSDIYAMNGTPEWITVSIACSNRFSAEAIEEIYKGIQKACGFYHIDLVGGDTTSSKAGLVLTVTVGGSVKKDKVVYRSGAKENELLCVSGDLGGAFTGLQILEREKAGFLANPDIQPELDEKSYIIERQLKPEARQDIIKELDKLDILPTSMIDISDGLASEILHLCKNSKLGAVLMEDKLPIDPMTYETAREFELDPSTCVLNGGEDYELLFTIKQNDFEKLRNNPSISVIGYMQEATLGTYMITKSGNRIELTAQGWRHF